MKFRRQKRVASPEETPQPARGPVGGEPDASAGSPSGRSDAAPVRLVELRDGEPTPGGKPEPARESVPASAGPGAAWPAEVRPPASSGAGQLAILVNPPGGGTPTGNGELDVIGPRVDKVLAFAREEATGTIERARALAAEIVAGARVQADAIVGAARQQGSEPVDGKARAERMESARLLRSARAEAEEILRQARAEAKAEVLRARDEADGIGAQALQSPDVAAEKGEVEAARVIADARSEAETLLTEARSQIAEHVEQARASLAAERAGVLAQIDQLEAKRDAMRAEVVRLTEVLAPVLAAARSSAPATPRDAERP